MNVTTASCVPVEDQIRPVWVPESLNALKYRMAVICPERATRNFMPSSYGTPSLTFGCAGICVVKRDCPLPLTAATVNVALPVVSPVDDAVIVAVPDEEAVKLDVAMPPLGVIGEAGLKEPETPLAEKVTALVAVVTVLPLASWIVAW